MAAKKRTRRLPPRVTIGMGSRRVLTVEKARAIALYLSTDPKVSIEQAALRYYVVPNTVRTALSAFRAGESSEADLEVIWPIAEALEHQCSELLKMGDTLTLKGKRADWPQWRLETKNRISYGRVTSTKLSGGDDGDSPIRLELDGMSDEELMAAAGVLPKPG